MSESLLIRTSALRFRPRAGVPAVHTLRRSRPGADRRRRSGRGSFPRSHDRDLAGLGADGAILKRGVDHRDGARLISSGCTRDGQRRRDRGGAARPACGAAALGRRRILSSLFSIRSSPLIDGSSWRLRVGAGAHARGDREGQEDGGSSGPPNSGYLAAACRRRQLWREPRELAVQGSQHGPEPAARRRTCGETNVCCN